MDATTCRLLSRCRLNSFTEKYIQYTFPCFSFTLIALLSISTELIFTCTIKPTIQVEEGVRWETLVCTDEFNYLSSRGRGDKETGNQNGEDVFRMWSSSKAKVHVFVVYILTYYKATFRANHVPRSVVLHQYGIRVVGTLNSGKGKSISAAEGEQQLSDGMAQKGAKKKKDKKGRIIKQGNPGGIERGKN